MAKSVKCNECGSQVDKALGEEYKNKYYHPECLELKLDRMSSWDKLFQLINSLYSVNKPTAMMFKQIKDYKSKPYDFTDDGIYMTLKYYYEILGNKVKEDTGLGIVPYYYDRAKAYYTSIYEIEDLVEEYEENESFTVVITNDKKTIMKKKSIDIDIDWGDYDESSEQEGD